MSADLPAASEIILKAISDAGKFQKTVREQISMSEHRWRGRVRTGNWTTWEIAGIAKILGRPIPVEGVDPVRVRDTRPAISKAILRAIAEAELTQKHVYGLLGLSEWQWYQRCHYGVLWTTKEIAAIVAIVRCVTFAELVELAPVGEDDDESEVA